MRHTLDLPIALALGLMAAGALAAPPAGRLLASQCAQCHGTNGNGPGFDKLAGMSARELSNEMREMKYRNNAEGIMDRQAHGYTDAQIQLIANYLSGQSTGGTVSGGTSTGATAGGTTGGTTNETKPASQDKQDKRRRIFSRDHRD